MASSCCRVLVGCYSAAVADCASLVERVRLIQEELIALVNEQTNRTLFVLTVVTVLALRLTIIPGLLGMNIGGPAVAGPRRRILVRRGVDDVNQRSWGLVCIRQASGFLAELQTSSHNSSGPTLIASLYPMTNSDQKDDLFSEQLEIIRLLDERFRLREDPARRSDLERTHARLRERLRRSREDKRPSSRRRIDD